MTALNGGARRRVAKRLGLVSDYSCGLTGFGFAVGFVCVVAVLVVLCLGVAITLQSRNCAYAQSQYQRATHYDWLAGCYISVGHGRSVGLDKYRAFQQVGR